MPARTRLVETRPTGHGRARGLVSSRKSGARIEAKTFAPPDELASVVAALWVGRWDLRGQAPHVTELLADPCVNFVFESGEKCRLVGVWTRLWRRTLAERGYVRAVKLKAGALPAFVDEPAHRFTNRIVPLETLFAETEALERAILDPDDETGLSALSEWLARVRRPTDGLAVRLVERIATDPEITTVEHLARVSGLTPRALQRLFRDEVGAAPKWVIRRNRLQEVALRLERGEGSLAALAADLGYTDQAHLTRDFKSAVGKSPRDFVRSVKA